MKNRVFMRNIGLHLPTCESLNFRVSLHMHLYSVWFQLFSGDFIVTLIIIISGYVYDVDNKQITVI